MASFGEALYNILSTDADVSAIVGDRIMPLVVTQGTALPAIRYQLINTEPVDTKDGVADCDFLNVQVDCFTNERKADSGGYTQAADLAKKVRTALDRKSGTFSGFAIDQITFENENDNFDEEMKIIQKSLDFKIFVKH